MIKIFPARPTTPIMKTGGTTPGNRGSRGKISSGQQPLHRSRKTISITSSNKPHASRTALAATATTFCCNGGPTSALLSLSACSSPFVFLLTHAQKLRGQDQQDKKAAAAAASTADNSAAGSSWGRDWAWPTVHSLLYDNAQDEEQAHRAVEHADDEPARPSERLGGSGMELTGNPPQEHYTQRHSAAAKAGLPDISDQLCEAAKLANSMVHKMVHRFETHEGLKVQGVHGPHELGGKADEINYVPHGLASGSLWVVAGGSTTTGFVEEVDYYVRNQTKLGVHIGPPLVMDSASMHGIGLLRQNELEKTVQDLQSMKPSKRAVFWKVLSAGFASLATRAKAFTNKTEVMKLDLDRLEYDMEEVKENRDIMVKQKYQTLQVLTKQRKIVERFRDEKNTTTSATAAAVEQNQNPAENQNSTEGNGQTGAGGAAATSSTTTKKKFKPKAFNKLPKQELELLQSPGLQPFLDERLKFENLDTLSLEELTEQLELLDDAHKQLSQTPIPEMPATGKPRKEKMPMALDDSPLQVELHSNRFTNEDDLGPELFVALKPFVTMHDKKHPASGERVKRPAVVPKAEQAALKNEQEESPSTTTRSASGSASRTPEHSSTGGYSTADSAGKVVSDGPRPSGSEAHSDEGSHSSHSGSESEGSHSHDRDEHEQPNLDVEQMDPATEGDLNDDPELPSEADGYGEYGECEDDCDEDMKHKSAEDIQDSFELFRLQFFSRAVWMYELTGVLQGVAQAADDFEIKEKRRYAEEQRKRVLHLGAKEETEEELQQRLHNEHLQINAELEKRTIKITFVYFDHKFTAEEHQQPPRHLYVKIPMLWCVRNVEFCNHGVHTWTKRAFTHLKHPIGRESHKLPEEESFFSVSFKPDNLAEVNENDALKGADNSYFSVRDISRLLHDRLPTGELMSLDHDESGVIDYHAGLDMTKELHSLMENSSPFMVQQWLQPGTKAKNGQLIPPISKNPKLHGNAGMTDEEAQAKRSHVWKHLQPIFAVPTSRSIKGKVRVSSPRTDKLLGEMKGNRFEEDWLESLVSYKNKITTPFFTSTIHHMNTKVVV
ncbi:unnamed protein product [Amoebophrya sp. A120]|nr:unnamed protein product [Amoebophrya sp. A120]|eukprot:GSA120T00013377001.1